jgi:hypothetical protein
MRIRAQALEALRRFRPRSKPADHRVLALAPPPQASTEKDVWAINLGPLKVVFIGVENARSRHQERHHEQPDS